MKNIKMIGVTLATSALATAAFAQGVDVTVDGRPLAASARTIDGRVFVPMRQIFEALGADVFYSPATKAVRASKGGKQIYLPLGSREAQIDGRTVTLDAPAVSIGGVTMVPLRFVGESLGANVAWRPAQRLVAITTNGGTGGSTGGAAGALTPEEREARRREREARLEREATERRINTVEAGTVIPVKLLTALDTKTLKEGDRFSATVDASQGTYYGGFPTGTILEGYVARTESKSNDNAVLDLKFDRMRLPSGRGIVIDGSLSTLDNKAIDRDENGRMVARRGTNNNTVVGGALGGVIGLIFGGNRRLENTVLAGALGALIGSQIKSQGGVRDVVLKPGTIMGVKINEDVSLYDNR